MRHIAILVLVLAVAATANAAELNCSKLSAPAQNFYAPSGSCANDTVIVGCANAYTTCLNAATTCSASMTCLTSKLRCFETAAAGSTCAAWSAMLSNEKLYLAAGGDYNGSALELSCKHAVCDVLKAKSSLACSNSTYTNICIDAVTTQAPATTPVPVPDSTTPPAGAIIVTFRIAGNKSAYDVLLSTPAGRDKARELLRKIFALIFNISGSKFVFTRIATASLLVDFYTTEPSLTLSVVQAKLVAAQSLDKTTVFGELAAAAGLPASALGIEDFTVGVATPAPVPVPGTPAPDLTGSSSSSVAALFAVVAALLALLL